jgi:hypothetical protein
MTEIEFQTSSKLSNVVLELIKTNEGFRKILIDASPTIIADIQSAAVNENCSCKNKVSNYIQLNAASIGSLLYRYANDNSILPSVIDLFSKINAPKVLISGKVAETTIKDWPEFVRNLKVSNYTFEHMSTSIVGEKVYVFFA